MAAVDTVPLAPLPGDPNFDALMQDFAFAMRPLSIQLNAAIQALNNNSTNAISSSSLTVDTGSKTLTASAGKSYVPGQPVRIASTANGAIWMEGDVTGYDPDTGALVVTVARKQGSGTIGSWAISLSPASLNLDRKGTAVASASSPNIWAGDGNSIHLTGSIPVTGFAAAPSAGMRQKVVLDDAPKLINSANLILPGATDYQCTAGDILDVYADTTTKFYVAITKANGRPVLSQQATAPWRFLKVEVFTTYGVANARAVDLVMTDGAGNSIILPTFLNGSSAALDEDIGAGGIDVAVTYTAGQLWYLYAICARDGTSQQLIYSRSASGPTLPSGFTHYAYLASTAIINALTPTVVGFTKFNHQVCLAAPLTVVDGTITSGAWTGLSFSGLIPCAVSQTLSRGARSVRLAFGGTGVHLGLRQFNANNSSYLPNAFFSGAIGGSSQAFGELPTARAKWITADVAAYTNDIQGGIQYYSDTTTGTICILGWEE